MQGLVPLHMAFAAAYCDKLGLSWLLDKGADINAADHKVQLLT